MDHLPLERNDISINSFASATVDPGSMTIDPPANGAPPSSAAPPMDDDSSSIDWHKVIDRTLPCLLVLLDSDELNFAPATSTTTAPVNSAIPSTSAVSDQAVHPSTGSVVMRREGPSRAISAGLPADVPVALTPRPSIVSSSAEEGYTGSGSQQDPDIGRELTEARGNALVQHVALLVKHVITTGDFTCLREEIDALLGIQDYFPAEHPVTLPLLDVLGYALADRFDRFGRISDLEQAISLLSRAVDLASRMDSVDLPSPGLLIELLHNLVCALKTRFNHLGQICDLEEAVSLGSRLVDLTPDGHPKMPTLLITLGGAFASRFDRLGELGDLERAISLQSRSVQLTPSGHSDMPGMLSTLGASFMSRHDCLGEMTDLEQAVSMTLRSVELTPNGHPDTPSRLNGLAGAIMQRFGHLGEISDLERVVFLQSRSVELTPDDHPAMPGRLTNLANVMKRRFNHLGNTSDLEQAISLISHSVTLIPDGHPDMLSQLSNLASAIEIRFRRLGKMSDLEQAISLQLHSVKSTPDDHPAMRNRLHDLASAIMARFGRLGEMSDLEQTISLMSHSIMLTPGGHPEMPSQLDNLGIVILRRFDRLGEMSDLDQAISLISCAIRLTHYSHLHMPNMLNHLGEALEMRYYRLGEIEDLEQAISLRLRSVDLTPKDHPDLRSYLRDLGSAILTRYNSLGEQDDLEHAILLRRYVVRLTPTTDPSYPICLNQLGNILQRFYTLIGQSGSCPNAVKCYEEAMASVNGFSQDRLQAVRHLAGLYRRSKTPDAKIPYDKLVEVYEYAYMLIPEIVWLGSSISRRYALLSDIRGVISGAAAAAIAAGQLTRAVGWIEQGRGVVWGQLLQLRSPIEKLNERHPELAQQLRDISSQLERSAAVADGVILRENTIRQDETSDEITVRVRLAQQHRELLAEVRRLEGFERFLMPKTYTEVSRAFSGGPVILINIDATRCDALVCISKERIVHVPLPEIDQRGIIAVSSTFVESLQTGRARQRADYQQAEPEQPSLQSRDEPAEHRASQSAAKKVVSLEKGLSVLWKKVIWPILQVIDIELTSHTTGVLPHVTWCTTGPLAYLPIHAAGDYTTPGGKKIFDYVVSSYAPTLSSLLPRSARAPRNESRSPRNESHSPQILIVSQPATPGLSPLPETTNEVANIKNHFKTHETLTLDGAEATAQAVWDVMGNHQCPYIHLACHGVQDPEDPMKSAFMLYKSKLELAMLMSKSSDNAVLAFLSACQTAKGDANLPEESVHLSAGMIAVGYRGVIGTLWSIVDEDAPLVTDVFYRVLKERQAMAMAMETRVNGSQVHAAYALHEATKQLRDKVGELSISRWAPFVHFGL